MHVLRALVLPGTPDQRALLASAGARIVPLPVAWVLVPAVAALLVRVAAQHPGLKESSSSACRGLTGALARFAELLSRSGSVAYVETDYFGGAGEQAACVWSRGQRVLRPRRARGGTVNAALRLLGVQACGLQDEFDAVDLGRYRETGSWLAEATDP